MSEKSIYQKIFDALDMAILAKTGVTLTWNEALELRGYIKSLEEAYVLEGNEYRAELAILKERICATCGGNGEVYWYWDNPETEVKEQAHGKCPDCNGTYLDVEIGMGVKNQKSLLGDAVMEIIGNALSGDCKKYLQFDLQGNRYCKWGIVEKDIRALFETSTDNNKPSHSDVSIT